MRVVMINEGGVSILLDSKGILGLQKSISVGNV
jgi:hypothetical protein